MAFSKVILNGETLMDVTGDNPTSSNMLTGTKATGADGRSVNGAVVTAPASDDNPAMDGVASPGSASTYSRGDHVHPKDTTKLDKSGGTLTGALTLSGAPTANLHAATKKYVDDAIGGVNSFEYEVVQALPTTNIKDHTIYLVPKTGTTGDVYDEYLRISNAWEHIGSTDVDLSGYVPTSRTVNGKALSSNISLTASDVGALPDSTTIPAQTAKIWTGTCNTGSGTVVKVVTLDDATGFSLTNGIKIAVTFGSEHGLSDIKLNVNNTGEKNVYIRTDASTISSDTNKINWGVASTVFFTYYSGGGYWFFEGSGRLQGKTYELASSALPKSGGTMTGALTLNADPTSNMQASTKQYVDTAVSAKQSKPTITSATLAVASWSNGVYSFESTYPNASYNIDVEPDGYTITDAQFKAWNEAKIVGNSNGNTIKALGTVPTVAIPVVVRATPK